MSGRQGGKLKPLKVRFPCTRRSYRCRFNVIQAPKKGKQEDDEETKANAQAVKEQKKAEATALAEAKRRGESSFVK